MKKFLARLSLLGLFAGLAASSYAVPAAAAAVDPSAAYDGPTTNLASDVIIIIIDEDFIWVEVYGTSATGSAPANALTDAAFDR
jgi:hypothetical protein